MTDSDSEGQKPTDDRRTDLQMTVCANGVVNVRNQRSGSGQGHSVFLDESGEAIRCTCKGHTHHGRCYHADAVESSPLVASASRAASTPRVAADGGEPEKTCDRCPTPLADVHARHEATVVTTDGEELCRECADSRSGEEIGFVDARTEVDRTEPADAHEDTLDPDWENPLL